jgi:hypothetical protein
MFIPFILMVLQCLSFTGTAAAANTNATLPAYMGGNPT